MRELLLPAGRWGLPEGRAMSHEIKPFRPADSEHEPALGTVASQQAPVTESALGVMTEPLN